MGRLDPMSFGMAGAIITGLSTLVLALVGSLGFYTGALALTEQWYLFFNLTPLGIVLGTIEAAVVGFIFTYIFAWIYNKIPHHAG